MILISRLAPFLTAWWQYRRKFVANRIQIYSRRRGMFMRERKTPAYRCLLSNRESRYFVWMSIRFATRGTLQGERADFFIIPFILIPSTNLSVFFFFFIRYPEPFPYEKSWWKVLIDDRIQNERDRKISESLFYTDRFSLVFCDDWHSISHDDL